MGKFDSFENYLDSLGFTENTKKSYVNDLELCFNYIIHEKKKNPSTIEPICEYLQHLSRDRKLSPATVERKITSIHTYFDYLKIISGKDFKIKIPYPKKPKKLPEFFSINEIKTILGSFNKTIENEYRYYFLILIFYGTGLRVSEVASLKMKQINEKTRQINIIGKGNKERIVYFPEFVLKEYLIYKDRFYDSMIQSDSVFFSSRKNILSKRGIEFILEKIGRKLKLSKRLRPHSLRHSFATHLLENGADIKKIGDILGHESLNTTQKYTHVNKRQLQDVISQFHPHSK